MNPAITAALIAAQHSDEMVDVVARLTKLGAVSIDKAVAFEPGSAAEAKQCDERIGQGLIERRGDGRLFVNQRAVEERKSRIAHGVIIALLVSVSVAVSVIALLTLT